MQVLKGFGFVIYCCRLKLHNENSSHHFAKELLKVFITDKIYNNPSRKADWFALHFNFSYERINNSINEE
jgi:hypothetical protein